MTTNIFAEWDEQETNRPGKPIVFIEPPEPLDGPEKILADLERASGKVLSPAQKQAAIESIRATGTFDIADVPDEPVVDDVFAEWDSTPATPKPALPERAPTRGYISGDGSVTNPFVGSPATMDLLMKTKPKDAWVRTPSGDITQRDTTFLEDSLGLLNRAVANVRHTMETLGPNAALTEATKVMESEKRGGMWEGNARTGFTWKPYTPGSAEAAREEFKAADRELASASLLHSRRSAEIPKSLSRQQQEKSLAEATTYGEGLEAFLTRPGATLGQAGEMAATFAPASMAAIVAPEVGIPAFATQITADTYTQGIDRYLAAKGVNPEDAEARAKFWEEHPEAVDEAITSRDLHTAAAMGASVAGPMAGKGISKVLSKGTPLASATKQFAANAVVQPAIFVASDRAAGALAGDKPSIAADLSAAVLPLPQMAHGARAGYKARVKADAARTRAITEEAYRIHQSDAALRTAKNQQEAMKEAVIRAQDSVNSKERQDKLKEDAFKKAEQERKYSAEQKAAEEEAGFQTIERQREVAGKTRLDKFPDGMERVPVKPRAEVTPEEVQAEWQSRKEAEDARLERVDVGAVTERIRSRQQAAAAKERAKAEAELAARTKAEAAKKRVDTIARNKIVDQVIAENPGKTPEELTAITRQRLADANLDAAPVPKPTPAPAPVKEAKPEVKAPEKAAPKSEADKVIDDYATKLGLPEADGLDMAAGKAPKTGTKEEFVGKIHEVVKGLVHQNTDKTNAVLDLITQGKLVIAPNGEAIGRPQDKGVASYSIKDGKMYMYTDRIDTKNPVSATIRAIHESTHGGQFNDREGRPDLLRQVMAGKYGAAHDAIIKARGKNKLADIAIDKALNAAVSKGSQAPEAERQAVTDRVADLELLPYFLGAAEESRSGYGRLGGVVRDAISGAQELMRKAGFKVDINLHDLVAASQKVPGEIVKTDLKARPEGGFMDMIGGEQGKEFANVPGQFIYKGKIDGKLRYEFSDKDSKINTEGPHWMNFRGGVAGAKLSDILKHDKLYVNYPDAKNIEVRVDPKLAGTTTLGTFHSDGSISMNPILTRPTNEGQFRKVLLHEIQHWIQGQEGFVEGANSASLVPRPITRAQKDANEAHQKAIEQFELGLAIKTLNPNGQEKWSKEIKSKGAANVKAMAQLFLDAGLYRMTNNREILRQGERYEATLDRKHEADNAYAKAETEAFKQYLRDYGEMEARNTETRADFEDAQRKLLEPESTMGLDKSGIPVEEAIDTRGLRYNNRGSESQSLEMLTPIKQKTEEFRRKLPAWVHGIFDSAQGAGPVAREIVEAAAASPSGQRMIAEGTLGKYRTALAKLAAERGMDIQALNKEISDKLDAVDRKTDGYTANLEAFTKVAEQYGDVGKALLDLRKQADDLSIQMLKARAEEGTPLNPEEIKTYTTIRNNLGRYAHRQYAIHLGENGRQYAEGIMADYAKYKKANGNVPESVKRNYEKVERVVRKLIDEQLVIPSDEVLAAIPKENVESIFETWASVTDPKAYTLEQKKAMLSDIRDKVNSNGDEMKRTAEEIVKQILELEDPTSPVVKYYRGGKLDKGILKQRANISPEIRDLMGEIKEPAMRMFVTVAKQVEFVARNRMLTELRDMNNPQHIQPPGNPGRKEVEGMIRLTDASYGPLQNHYVSKNLHNLLSDHVQQLANFEQAIAMAASRNDVLAQLAATKAVRAWGSIAGTAKMLQIIYKPVNFLYNFLGGPRTMLIHGNVNPKYMLEATKTARDIIHYSINPTSNSPLARRAATAGITDSAFNGEIRGELLTELNKTLRDMKGESSSNLMKALRKAKDFTVKGKTVTNETYAMMDVTYKIANFLQQADRLKAYYEAEGIKKTPEQIDREAADITNRTNVTYKRAAPMVRALEKYGVTNFGTFFYEVFRSEVNNLRQGFAELRRANESKTPEGANMMRMQGARRLLGQLTAWSLTAAASRGLGTMVFGDDKEEEKKLRGMLPDYMQTKDFIEAGKDKDGKPVLFDVSRLDPAGPATDIMRAALNSDADIDQLEQQVFQLYVAPRIAKKTFDAIGTSVGFNDKKPSEPTMQQLFPESFGGMLKATNAAGLEDRTTKAWTNVAETFLPGVVTSWRKNNARPVIDDPASATAWAMTYAGASMYRANPDAVAKDASVSYSDEMKLARKKIKESFVDNPEMNQDELTGRLHDIKEGEEAQFNKLLKVYEGMEALGMSDREIAKKLKNADVPVAVIRDLKKGEFKFRAVTKKSVEQFRQRELAAASTPEEKLAVKQKWKDIWAMLRTSEEQLSNEDEE